MVLLYVACARESFIPVSDSSSRKMKVLTSTSRSRRSRSPRLVCSVLKHASYA